MHGVVKETSSTTKLRIVFDGSAASSSGHSLNDVLLHGPSLYPLLPSVLTQFRLFPIALTGNVSKMFWEVGLRNEDRDFHWFLHRGPTGEIIDYRMTRVTFGITISPYLASQVLLRIAEDYHLEYPAAAQIIKTSFYVDDVLTGADTVEEAAQLRSDLNLLLAKGKLNTTPENLREVSGLDLTVASTGHCRTLGIHWDTGQDEFFISIPDLSRSSTASKRTISSVVARVFDVMGWFSPAILPAKLLLQEAWCLQVGWDDPLPDYLQQNWESWLQGVPVILSHIL